MQPGRAGPGHPQFQPPVGAELLLHADAGMAPFGVRDLMPQYPGEMVFGVEIVDQAGVDIDKAARRTECIEDLVHFSGL